MPAFRCPARGNASASGRAGDLPASTRSCPLGLTKLCWAVCGSTLSLVPHSQPGRTPFILQATEELGAEQLLRQNMELVCELQRVTSAYEQVQAQVTASAPERGAADTDGNRTVSTAGLSVMQAHQCVRPTAGPLLMLILADPVQGSATSIPATPASQLTLDVRSCLDLMRTTRVQLAGRTACLTGGAIVDGGWAGQPFGSPAPCSPSSSGLVLQGQQDDHLLAAGRQQRPVTCSQAGQPSTQRSASTSPSKRAPAGEAIQGSPAKSVSGHRAGTRNEKQSLGPTT